MILPAVVRLDKSWLYMTSLINSQLLPSGYLLATYLNKKGGHIGPPI
jgi:hypothetical protein